MITFVKYLREWNKNINEKGRNESFAQKWKIPRKTGSTKDVMESQRNLKSTKFACWRLAPFFRESTLFSAIKYKKMEKCGATRV